MIVQQLVGLALEVAVVEHFHQGVFVGLLDYHIAVGSIQALGSGGGTLDLGAVGGLTTAHDTAAGAGHDFDEMVFLAAGLHIFQNLACIGQTGGDADLHINAIVRHGEFLDALVTADTALSDGVQGGSIMAFYQATQIFTSMPL